MSPRRGDFVYLDPPYPALNATAYFAHYTKERFTWKDHEDLASRVGLMHRRGAKFLLSIADIDSSRTLYKGFDLCVVPVIRYVTCKGTKRAVRELIVRNY